MFKNILFITFFGVSAYADMTSFFQAALNTLKYNKAYTLTKQANKTAQSAITYKKYTDFSADIAYTKTYAKLLPNAPGSFGTTDAALHDTIDIFGKNNYKIQALRFDTQMEKSRLDLKKEQLFIALVNMIALYNKTKAQLELREKLYDTQHKIYKKLTTLEQNGNITEIEVLRFKNTLTTLQTSIVAMQQQLSKMAAQLHLYALGEAIPKLTQTKIRYTKEAFLHHNPKELLNQLDAKKLLTESKGAKSRYIPTLDLFAAYQKLDDPTSFGDNHSFGATLHLPLSGGDYKEAEALKVAALSKETQSIQYEIEREKEYIAHLQAYKNAKKQLEVLEASRKDFEKSETTIQKAYLRQYVDFNTYLQVLKQALDVKSHIAALQNEMSKEATIINAIASGKVYE